MQLCPRISGLHQITNDYDAIFCDVWGVLHNGMRPWLEACDALCRFRETSGIVILITNSPKPSQFVRQQLIDIGIPSTGMCDGIVSSGDVTRALISQTSKRIFFLGPERDEVLFEGLDVEYCSVESADVVVCTGMFDDENEVPGDYNELLQKFGDRKLPLICANPDIVVHRGAKSIWCAGALARNYEMIGGKVLIAGKPHNPIYQEATRLMLEVNHNNKKDPRVLAIGDGMPTDVIGALKNGFELLYVSAGIHVEEYGSPDNPDPTKLQEFLRTNGVQPIGYLPRLIW